MSGDTGNGLTGAADGIVFCYREGIDDYPREHGSYRGSAGRLTSQPAVSKQDFLDAMDTVRKRHDPARDWRSFSEAAWGEAARLSAGR